MAQARQVNLQDLHVLLRRARVEHHDAFIPGDRAFLDRLLQHTDAETRRTLSQSAEGVKGSGDISCMSGIVWVVTGGGLKGSRRILHCAGHWTCVVDALV